MIFLPLEPMVLLMILRKSIKFYRKYERQKFWERVFAVVATAYVGYLLFCIGMELQ